LPRRNNALLLLDFALGRPLAQQKGGKAKTR
jgi:hypothetical protein